MIGSLSFARMEAVETAIRMAKQYHYNNGDRGKYKVISRVGSYHGVTMGALSVNGSNYVNRAPFEPLVPGKAMGQSIGVIGGGTMGQGIVRCFLAAGGFPLPFSTSHPPTGSSPEDHLFLSRFREENIPGGRKDNPGAPDLCPFQSSWIPSPFGKI